MKKENTAAIARRMAYQFWGEIQEQKKLAPGIWWYTTAGHGGIVVDIKERPELAEYQSTVYYGRDQRWYIESEQHFAAFEEDCAAAIVEWQYPEVWKKVYQLFETKEPLMEWAAKRQELLKSSLARWNPEYLAKHPDLPMERFKI